MQYNKAENTSASTHTDNVNTNAINSPVSGGNNSGAAAAALETKQIELEFLKKEDDEFSALESKFITELGLQAQ